MPYIFGLSDHVGIKITLTKIDKIEAKENFIQVRDLKDAKKKSTNLLIKLLNGQNLDEILEAFEDR